jgi:ankyrin repeat protein
LGILHIAAIANKDPDITLELLRKGMAIEEKDHGGNTALLQAAINGKTGVVKVLLEHGAETEVRNRQSQNTPLLHAIARSHISAAQCLVENGADLSAETNWGWQAIHEAVRFEAKPLISMLIDRGQLEIAVDQPSSEAMHGLRPLHIAVRETMNAEIIKMLVEKGANIEARTHLQLQTAFLNIAETRMSGVAKTEKEMLAMAKLLVNLGADVRATDDLGKNLLFGAARERAVSLFEFLLEQGLSIDSESATGITVLQVAAIGGKTETIKYLLEKGADKLHQTNVGNTALHMAVSWGRLDAVKLLATIRGQELDIKDNDDNKTPLDLARACKWGNRTEATIELREKAKKNADDIYNFLFYLRYPAYDL